MPVLFELLLDSALGDGELYRCGFFVLFLLFALGALSESGGPGVSVPASLSSGATSWGPSDLVVLSSFGGFRTRGLGISTRLLGGGLSYSDGPGMGSRLRGNDG